jgi:3'-phosphoadenosine 5'-phosphosulfate sulfotransferase (PAPS reductase)/FAD synthetase
MPVSPNQFRLPFPTAPVATVKLDSYDHIIVAFSGGKDSLACLLHVLEQGADPARIELWHHEVDGREGRRLMDWPCTTSYVRKVAQALGVSLRSSWREGGIEGEMMRENQPTGAVWFEDGAGQMVRTGGDSDKLNTRLRFPQVGNDLSTRWCSAVAKIGVADAAINNQDRFLNRRTLFVTGERAEESSARANYAVLEPHRRDTRNGTRRRRHVDHWRCVHGWTEAEVWRIIEKWNVNPHPAYRLGFSRCSCATCIFSGDDHWATLKVILPEQFAAISAREQQFGVSIDRAKRSVCTRAARGRSFTMDPSVVIEATSEEWPGEAILLPGTWRLPIGAFGSPGSGPS